MENWHEEKRRKAREERASENRWGCGALIVVVVAIIFVGGLLGYLTR